MVGAIFGLGLSVMLAMLGAGCAVHFGKGNGSIDALVAVVAPLLAILVAFLAGFYAQAA